MTDSAHQRKNNQEELKTFFVEQDARMQYTSLNSVSLPHSYGTLTQRNFREKRMQGGELSSGSQLGNEEYWHSDSRPKAHTFPSFYPFVRYTPGSLRLLSTRPHM